MTMTIHQIQLGFRHLTDKQVAWAETWRRNHPDNAFVLWVDAPDVVPKDGPWTDVRIAPSIDIAPVVVPPLVQMEPKEGYAEPFDIRNPPLEAMSTTVHVARSDILRVQLLRDYAGLYVDTDTACLRNVERLFRGHPIAITREWGQMCIGSCVLYADKPRHAAWYRFQDAVVNEIRDASLLKATMCPNKWAQKYHLLNTTGPWRLNKVLGAFGDVVILPFNQCCAHNTDHAVPDNVDPKFYPPEAHILHFYNGSWMRQDSEFQVRPSRPAPMNEGDNYGTEPWPHWPRMNTDKNLRVVAPQRLIGE